MRPLLLIALVVVIAGLVIGIPAAFSKALPDMNAAERNGEPATSYADIKTTFTLTATEECIQFWTTTTCLRELRLAAGESWIIHEVLATPTGPATVFDLEALTLGELGENCQAKINMFYGTPDDSGREDSQAKDFRLNTPTTFQMGHLNMYSEGTMTLQYDILANGCGVLTTWTKIGQSSIHTRYFDGNDET